MAKALTAKSFDFHKARLKTAEERELKREGKKKGLAAAQAILAGQKTVQALDAAKKDELLQAICEHLGIL
jgi:hypothetical protein